MPLMSGRVLSANRVPAVNAWAMGYYTGADGNKKPVCYFKPKGMPWQLKYVGADILTGWESSFWSGFRRRGDTPGVIYSANLHRNQSNQSGTICTGARSDDSGATWTRFRLDSTVSLYSLFASTPILQGCCSPAAGVLLVSAGPGPFTAALFHRSVAGGNMFDVAMPYPQAGLTIASVPDFLCYEVEETPTKQKVLKLPISYAGASSPPPTAAIWASYDDGATWVVEQVLSVTGDLGLRAPVDITADKKLALFAAQQTGASRHWYSADLTTWTRATGAPSGSIALVGCGGMTRKKWLAGSSSSVFKTVDAGATYSGVSKNMTRMRRVGNRFYGCNGSIIVSSVDGVAWATESLPASGTPTITFTDVFGH